MSEPSKAENDYTPMWTIVTDNDDREWPCTIVDQQGRSLLALHNGTPVIRDRALAERIVTALNEQHDPTPETTDAFCEVCLSLMVEDDGAGYLCPVCDQHVDCTDYPCSGEQGLREVVPCVLNAPLGSRSYRPADEGGA